MLQLKSIGQHQGEEVLEVDLQFDNQVVSIMNYGCVIRDWQVNLNAKPRHVVLGFDNFEPYPDHSPHFGTIAGRVANRTANGRFELNNKSYQLPCNNGNHHLHGGPVGLAKRLWSMEPDTEHNAVRLALRSPHDEQGYPGTVDFTVVFTLDEQGLSCRMDAMPDCATPINLAQHSYYNLDGAGSAREHKLKVLAQTYLPVDEELIPTGVIEAVEGTLMDFRHEISIAESDPDGEGHDHNLILDNARDTTLPAAVLSSASGDLKLEILTDQPGIQLYTGKKLAVSVPGHDGARYTAFGGICLEPQHFPDSLNHASWPSIVCTPEKPYHQALTMSIKAG